MPELPEVETVRTGLAKLLIGKTVAEVDYNWPKSFPNEPDAVNKLLIGAKAVAVKRRGKVLIIELSSGYCLITHLKMTGQLVFVGQERFGAGHPNDSLVGKLPDKSTRVTLTFTNGSKLFFNDQRKFGWMKLLPTNQLYNDPFMASHGPEPLAPEFSLKLFKQQLARRVNSPIKAAIIDPKVIAGVGNIYADESLWLAKIHPATKVGKVSATKQKALHQAIIDVLKLGIAKGGSSDRNYVDAEGRRGSYLSVAKVFRREGQACHRCGHDIVKLRVAGRGTHICPHCQRLVK